MVKTMTIDPGDHIGVLMVYEVSTRDKPIHIEGCTIENNDNRLINLWDLLNGFQPDKIIYERFALRANAAQKLVGNTFVTCEVIGIIKLYVQLNNIELVELLPSCKEYCGFSASPKDPRYEVIKILHNQKISEHVRDTYRLYSYYSLFGDKISK